MRLHSMVAAGISTGTSVSPDSQVHLSTTEKPLFKHQGSDTDGGHAVSPTISTPEIVANEEAYTRIQEYAEKSTMVSVTKYTSTQGPLKFEAKVTSIEPSLGKTRLKKSSDSFESMLETAPPTRMQALPKSEIGDKQTIDKKSDLGFPKRASENLVPSLTSERYYTNSTVHALSKLPSTIFTEVSQVPHFSRVVNNHTSTAFSRRIARKSSDVDIAGTHISESFNVQTSPVYDHVTTAAEERQIISAARTTADAVINSKGNSDTFLTKPATPISTTVEKREIIHENLLRGETPLAYYTETTPVPTKPMLITLRFDRTSTAAFRRRNFAHTHEVETTHHVSPIAERERFRRISTASVDQTQPMADSAATPVITTLNREVDVPFVTNAKLAATEVFIAPSVRATSGNGNRHVDLGSSHQGQRTTHYFH
ncbi:uncharacterized protein LOC119443974 isoform X1 [Dermacentor silvarum]|uniref:uncharacterized protein LOC119443974 isoform X1 n=1 Tax=Dermacentor silvarum TaxID=543639 RepID=UPI002101C33F|nr:uncharacterized protein LOC119443974 isoform X1 [Dermacentor silvarum]XP_049519494.1 uncharacterized protein LOC119443974 isoform X1 [Dermacentor silvarum]